MSAPRKKEFGDFQTPPVLAAQVLEIVLRGRRFAAVVEPTCGIGAFLKAAADRLPPATALFGFDIDRTHLAEARRAIPAARLEHADFFTHAWEKFFAALPEPILILGNPPWVTSAEQGKIGGVNLPRKENFQAMKGLDAKTGRANFDVAEWILLRLLEALRGRSATIAMLVKSSVARRVLLHAWRTELPLRNTALHAIDAPKLFGATVSACLLETTLAETPERSATTHGHLGAPPDASRLGFADGRLIADLDAYERWRHLAAIDDATTERARPHVRWRSGIKHDAAPIMELTRTGGGWVNGLGETCDVEPDRLFPLLKAGDLARSETPSADRRLLLPQLTVGEDTRALEGSHPRAWNYLLAHARAFDRRASSIYRRRPRFAIFGIGAYSFAPWKLAISGLHKSLDFRLVGPRDDRPVVFDDTCYFLPFDSESDARSAKRAFSSPAARALLSAMIFWDAKRPITADVLGRLDLRAATDYAEPV